MADDPLAQAVKVAEATARVRDNLCEMTLRCDWGDHTIDPADLRIILAALHAAREDAARLDWMESFGSAGAGIYAESGGEAFDWSRSKDSLRAAIDAARAANQEGRT